MVLAMLGFDNPAKKVLSVLVGGVKEAGIDKIQKDIELSLLAPATEFIGKEAPLDDRLTAVLSVAFAKATKNSAEDTTIVVIDEFHLLEALFEGPDGEDSEGCNYLAGFFRQNKVSLDSLHEAIQNERRSKNSSLAGLCVNLLTFASFAKNSTEIVIQTKIFELVLELFRCFKSETVSAEDKLTLGGILLNTIVLTQKDDFASEVWRILLLCHNGDKKSLGGLLESLINQTEHPSLKERNLVLVWQHLNDGKPYSRLLPIILDPLGKISGETIVRDK
jgi:hypothetical protein